MRIHSVVFIVLFLLIANGAQAINSGNFEKLLRSSEIAEGISTDATAGKELAIPDSDKILFVEITRSHREKEAYSTAFHYEEGRKSFYFSCKARSIASIVRNLLEIGSERLRVDPSAPAGLYDVQYHHQQPSRGKRHDRTHLIETILKGVGAEVEEITEEQDAWVARHNDMPLPSGEGGLMRGGMIVDKTGQCIGQNVPLPKFFNMIEKRYGVYIEDETALTGRYDLTYDTKYDFEKLRSYLADEYGIVLRKQTRKIKLFKLTSPTVKKTALIQHEKR